MPDVEARGGGTGGVTYANMLIHGVGSTYLACNCSDWGVEVMKNASG